MAADTTTESENKALLRRWFEEVWNQGREDLIDQLRAPEAVATGLGEGDKKVAGSTVFKGYFSKMRAAISDLHIQIEDILAEGDKVAVRLSADGIHRGEGLGVAPTGRRVHFTGISIVRVTNGRIVEAWNNFDYLGLLAQIGAVPTNPEQDRFLS